MVYGGAIINNIFTKVKREDVYEMGLYKRGCSRDFLL